MLELFVDVGSDEGLVLRLVPIFGEKEGEDITPLKAIHLIRHGTTFPTHNIKACTPTVSEGSNQVGSAQPTRESHGR